MPRLRGLPGIGQESEVRRTPKTAEVVAQRVVRDVASGGLAPGDRLPNEAVMAEQYRVSRTTLREALRLLEVQGLITLKTGPGGGPVVGEVDAVNLARTISLYFNTGGMTYGDLFATQGLLEETCADLAARHPDRDELREAFAPFTEVGHPCSDDAYYSATLDFHRLIHEFAGNPILVLVTRAVGHIVATHVFATMDPIFLQDPILEDHRKIARALIRGQAAQARRLTAAHYQTRAQYLREKWPARFDESVEWR
ncbi:MAG: FadR/GntR family transcriptional regulator [Acidimicrobiia bacterium]